MADTSSKKDDWDEWAYKEIEEEPLLSERANVGPEDADVVRPERSWLVDGAEEILDLERVEVERPVRRLRRMAPLGRDPWMRRVVVDRPTICRSGKERGSGVSHLPDRKGDLPHCNESKSSWKTNGTDR